MENGFAGNSHLQHRELSLSLMPFLAWKTWSAGFSPSHRLEVDTSTASWHPSKLQTGHFGRYMYRQRPQAFFW
jgi:hypothetical protein